MILEPAEVDEFVALRALFAELEKRHRDGCATPQSVLALMNAVDGGDRGDAGKSTPAAHRPNSGAYVPWESPDTAMLGTVGYRYLGGKRR